MMRLLKYFGLFVLVIVLIYAIGPSVKFDQIDFNKKQKLDISIESIEDYVMGRESKVMYLKDGNEAQILWADSIGQRTEYSIVYLHGFSASHKEGDPIHKNIAKKYGANLYLSRLYDHGRADTNSLQKLTPELLYRSAEEALLIGKLIGEKVIVMSCSTGGTLDVMLAESYPEVAAHIMYSPNFKIYDPTAALVTWPWGEQIMEQVMGGEYKEVAYDDEAKQYWNEKYHNDGILALQSILDNYMTIDYFKNIQTPTFVGVYYKNEEEQDKVISVSAAEKFMQEISTTNQNKRFIKFPDVGRHVLSSSMFSHDLTSVEKETVKFIEEVLNIKPQINGHDK